MPRKALLNLPLWASRASIGVLVIASSAAAADMGAAERSPTPPLLLAVQINGSDQGSGFQLLQLPDGGLAATETDLAAWHLKPPAESFEADGQRYHLLGAIAGLSYRIAAADQTLVIQAPPPAFVSTTFADQTSAASPTPTSTGGFLNYDLQAQRVDGREWASGLFEGGVFGAFGSFDTTGVWNGAGGDGRWVRLDTTWTIDDLQQMSSLRLGDAIGKTSAWGRSVRFGGIQWGTNFATRPDFIAFPQQGLHGEAALPSTIDVYVNQVRQLHGSVAPGPFDIPAVPVVTGQGQMQLVITDPLGRQQVITRPYYVSPGMLRPGLHDFSIEAGAVREDYGIADAHYGPGVFAATDRLGVTPEFTRELRAEAMPGQQTIGAGGVWLWQAIGAMNLAAAASHGPEGGGHLVQAGVERQARDVSLAIEATFASRAFAQIGILPGLTPRQSLSASIGVPFAGSGLGLTLLRQTTWQGADNRMASASYSMKLGSFGMLGFHATRDFSGGATVLGLNLVHVLDARSSVGANIEGIGDRPQATLQIQHSLPPGDGFGYRLQAGEDPNGGNYDAGGTWRTDRGDASAEASRQAGSQGYRAGISGGIGVLGGDAYATRRIDDSFALVKVADFANVRVYRDNQEIGRTGADGRFLATGLRSYQPNPLMVEQADLPIDAETDLLQVTVTPGLRTGVDAEIPVRRVRSAMFRLVDERGQPMPAGTLLGVQGQDRRFPVGFDGLAFVTLAGNSSVRIDASADGIGCSAVVALGNGDARADLGTIVCKRGTP